MTSSVRVGEYYVRGDGAYAVVVERRANRDYILEEFKGTKDDLSAFERAKDWAIKTSANTV